MKILMFKKDYQLNKDWAKLKYNADDPKFPSRRNRYAKNKFASEAVREKLNHQIAPTIPIDEEESQTSHSSINYKSKRDRYGKKNWGSTPVNNFGDFGKGNNSMQDSNMAGMNSNHVPGFVPTPPGFINMGKMSGYQNQGIPYQMPPNLSQSDNQNLMPSISQQLNNLNLSNQNMFLQNQLVASAMMNMGGQMNNTGVNNQLINSGGMSQEQFQILLSLQKQNNIPAPKIPEPSYPGQQFSVMGMHTSSMTDLTKQFISSMKDLSGKGKTTGILKFFNEGKGFGFFVSDTDGKDVFFHYEDVKDLKITKDFLREAKNRYIVKFAFTVQIYYGKYNYSTKAIDIELLGIVDLRFLSCSEPSISV